VRAAAAFLILALAPGALPALEKASPEAVHERRTADADQVSLKPVFLFDMRGRKDPFVPYALMTATAKVAGLDIREMQFGGLLQVRDQRVALFQALGVHYTLKGGKLYGPDGALIPGVHGRVVKQGVDEGQVLLEQGEQHLLFSDRRVSKRLEDQNNHD
jgi:hypothetical protein